MKNNAESKKINVTALLIGVLLLAAGTASLFYWGTKKEVWFCDEIYTYESSNGFEQDWPAAYTDEWMSGSDVEAFFAADRDTLSLNDITVRLYNDHVPLYFWLFRMVSFFFFKGSGSIWIGLSINLLFYLIFIGLCYKLFLRLTENPLSAGIILFFTCIVNRLVIEQVTVLRMYMMLLLAEAMLILGALKILCESEKGRLRPGLFIYLFAVSVMGFLTHYDFWIFYASTAFLFCLWLLCMAIRKKGRKFRVSSEFKYVLAWSGSFVAALLTTIWLFPYCKWNLNRGKGQIALKSLFVFSGEKVEQILWGYRRLSAAIFGDTVPAALGLLVIFCCISGGAFLLYRIKEHSLSAGLLLTATVAQIYQLIVCFTMPDVSEERYLWGAFTIMMFCSVFGGFLLLQVACSLIKDKKLQQNVHWITGIILSACLLFCQLSVIDGGKGIAYLFYEEKDVDLLKENHDIPWIVYGPTVGVYSYYDWLIPERICFLTENNTAEDAAAVNKLQSERFVLYLYEDYLPDALRFFEQELGYELHAEYLTKSTNLTVYLVERDLSVR